MSEWQPITALRTTEKFVLVAAPGMLPAVALLHARQDVNGHELFKQPTHWMPLPDPPESTE